MGVRQIHLKSTSAQITAIRRPAFTIIRYVDHDRVSIRKVGTLIPPLLQPMFSPRFLPPLFQPPLQLRTQPRSKLVNLALTRVILTFIPSKSLQRRLQLAKRRVQLWHRKFLEQSLPTKAGRADRWCRSKGFPVIGTRRHGSL